MKLTNREQIQALCMSNATNEAEPNQSTDLVFLKIWRLTDRASWRARR